MPSKTGSRMPMSERKPHPKAKNTKSGTPASKKAAAKVKAKPKPKGTKAVHTVPHDKGWATKRAGSDRVSKVFSTKAEAVKAGRETARREKAEHIIHTADGKIGARNSYGNDPRDRKG